MRPAGVVLIAIYHFLSAACLVLIAIALMVGGSVLGALVGAGTNTGRLGLGFGMALGILSATVMFVFAVIAAAAGYGVWNLREWGRVLCIVLAVIFLLLSLPGLVMMGVHFALGVGSFHLIRTAINVLIIWYLVQPQVKTLFQVRAPALRHS
jgi:hypothetical protein